jgi:hypothetical protein
MVAALAAVALAGCILGETGDARAIADEAATLQGRLFSDEPGDGVFWFEYGTTTAYGQSTERTTHWVQDDGWVEVSQVAGGLEPDTTYHYRLCGEGGPSPRGRCGDDRTFVTGVGRRSVRGSATDAGGGFASVDAAVDPDGSYLDGVAEYRGTVQTPTHPPLPWGGSGEANCMRVEGSVATVGFSWNDPILGPTQGILVIEDNGFADRVMLLVGESTCPTPDPSLLTGQTAHGDFVIDGT